MKKSATEMLKVFAADPIKAKSAYQENARHWNTDDIDFFWEQAMKNYPNDKFKRMANRLIKFLYENDLIDYEDIVYDFFEYQKSSCYACDIDLRTHTLNYISGNYVWWFDNYSYYDGKELLEEVWRVKSVCWYWGELLSYCVEKKAEKYGFVERAVDEAKKSLN